MHIQATFSKYGRRGCGEDSLWVQVWALLMVENAILFCEWLSNVPAGNGQYIKKIN